MPGWVNVGTIRGPEGPRGEDGPAGPPGNTIWAGAVLPGPGLGRDGDFFLHQPGGGVTVLYGPRVSGDWPSNGVSLVGPAGQDGDDGQRGEQGVPGNTVLSGSGPPANSAGADGDYYMDINAGIIYGPRYASTWPAGRSLVGPQGLKGDPGVGVNIKGQVADPSSNPPGQSGDAWLDLDGNLWTWNPA